MSANVIWTFGKNKSQEYYECTINETYLCVVKNKWESFWFGMVGNSLLHNKTKNDRQRIKQHLEKKAPLHLLRCDCILTSHDPEYMKKKVIYCYRHGINEISE